MNETTTDVPEAHSEATQEAVRCYKEGFNAGCEAALKETLPTIKVLIERYGTGYNANDAEIVAARNLVELLEIQ